MGITLGEAIFMAVKPIFKIILNILMGIVLAKSNILTVEAGRTIASMILMVLYPCLIFNKIVSSLDGSVIKMIGIMVLGTSLLTAIGFVGGFLLILFFPCPKQWRGGFVANTVWNNTGDLPIAYIQSMATGSLFTTSQADLGVAYATICLAVATFTFWNLGGYYLIESDFRDRLVNKDDEESQANSKIPEEEPDFTPILSLRSIKFWSDTENDITEKESQSRTPCPVENKSPKIVSKNVAPSVSGQSSNDTNISLENVSQEMIHELTQVRSLNISLHNVSSQVSYSQSMSNLPSTTRILSYSSELRRRPTQTMDDIIREYSEADIIRQASRDGRIERTTSIFSMEPISIKSSPLIPEKKERKNLFFMVFNGIVFFIKNCKKPLPLALIISIVITMIPWTRALFYKKASVQLPQAPDGLPMFNFIMDFTSFVGNAAVPLGLSMLGATISRLKLKNMPIGFYVNIILMSLLKLVILPIIFIALALKFQDIGWIEKTDILAPFILILVSAVPTQTSNIYVTAFYSPPGAHVEMDCVALTFLIQYPLLIITLPIVMTYTLKNVIGE